MNSNFQAVILAGGKGTRLGELAREVPKPMVRVAGKPILEHQIACLSRYGFSKITLIVNHLADAIEGFFGDGRSLGVEISYFRETVPLGTVGGLKEIEPELQEDFLLVYGDVMFDMDLGRLWAFHKQHKADATLVLHPNDHPYDSDLVEVEEDGRITHFYPKPRSDKDILPNMVNAGVYAMNRSICRFLERGKKADFGRDIFPDIAPKASLYGYNTPEYLKDMGTPDRLEKVEADILSGKIRRSNLENARPAIFLDRDGVINHDEHLIASLDDFHLYEFTGKALKKINQSGYLSVVTTNQSVVARNLCTLEELRRIHNKMETLLGKEGAYFDAIFFCPYHPDKGYPEENPAYKRTHSWRKPKSGMLREAASRFNIDLASSFMIGDSERDTLAGKNAGVTTIGVRTGKGLRGSSVLPDYIFEDLEKAVSFIVDDPLRPWAEEMLSDIQRKKEGADYVLLIGGNSRSGKSTYARYLSRFLSARGLAVTEVCLDWWVKRSGERNPEDDVYARFRTDRVEREILEVLEGGTVTITPYRNHPSFTAESFTLRRKPGPGVIIVEGVIVLGLDKLMEKADRKIHIRISEEELRKRIWDFYGWKGLGEAEINTIFNSRLEDEYRPVEDLGKRADQIMNCLTL